MHDAELFQAIYSFAGLAVGCVAILSGLLLFLLGVLHPSGSWHVKFCGLEIRNAAPGLAFAFLGALVIYLTRLA